jgi:hypothetical protein
MTEFEEKLNAQKFMYWKLETEAKREIQRLHTVEKAAADMSMQIEKLRLEASGAPFRRAASI